MCNHKWRRVYEEFLLGGSFPVGWECILCDKYVDNNQITPAGLGGIVLENSVKLVGPHGGYGTTSKGNCYKSQIIDGDGNLIIE